jgi:proteasome lid subunit RPN8/RPN11
MVSGSFDDYLTSLKEEAERGSTPNHSIEIDKYIKVSQNLERRINEIEPVESMSCRTKYSLRTPDSKKELYDLSQKYMLMTRYVNLFTKVIWSHPSAACCEDVPKCRQKAIDFLHTLPSLRERLSRSWERTNPTDFAIQRTASDSNTDFVPSSVQPAKYPKLDSVFPTQNVDAKYPELNDDLTGSSKRGFQDPRGETSVSFQPPAKQKSFMSSGIHIPFELPEIFSKLANENTRKGIETCGMLLGYQQGGSNILVTTLIVPQQSGTRDTCETSEGAEEDILSYTLSNDLMTVGIIHTHPTQECFLSSVDMHTILSYQQMLPDAISIVVAPTDRALPVGVFRLTEHGFAKIRSCKLHGFHDHEGKEHYTTLVKDIVWDPSLKLVVVDNRK